MGHAEEDEIMNPHIEKLLRSKYDRTQKPLESLVVVIKHRGAERDEKTIDGRDIREVKKNGFFIDDTFIPAHRIKEVHSK